MDLKKGDFKELFNKYRGVNDRVVALAQLETLDELKNKEIAVDNTEVVELLKILIEKVEENTAEIKKIKTTSGTTRKASTAK